MDDAAHDATLTGSYEIERETPSAPPTRVGRYEIVEVLGSGAMGVVYRARDPELDRPVAIKVVRTGGGRSSGARLLREAQAMARLRHPNVLPIFDVGPAEDAVFVAMPLIEGGTLRHWLNSGGRSFDAILDRFVAAGRGLAAAHAAGLVHRDFKPDNVLLGSDGEVHVADFGLARLAGRDGHHVGVDLQRADELSQTGDVVGTPAYMSPEQLRGQLSDARADQFSYCVALWEGVYGERPFPRLAAKAEEPLRQRLDAIAAGPTAPSRRDRPAWVAQLLTRGLAADPHDRWPTMQALLDAIAAHRAPRRWPRRVTAATAAVVAIGLGVAIAAIARLESSSATPPIVVVPLTHGGDLKRAAISPDGSKLALVSGGTLVIRGIRPDAEERVVVDHGIADLPITWSSDGRHLLAPTVPEFAPLAETEVVDIERGAQFKLPVRGIASFLSPTEVAVTHYRQRSITILPVGEHATATATCEVPGDYTFLWSLVGMPDGTMIVQTRKSETARLVILRRDCSVRATFSGEPISSVALSDTATLVAMVAGDGFGEIIEISLDGVILSRRRVTGDVDEILGRRNGTDYISRLALKTHLVRVHGTDPAVRQFSVNGSASFSLAPDGTLAWVELGNRTRGPLRLATVDGLPRRSPPVLDNAVMASWSPDGTRLAVLVDEDADAQIVVVDRRTPSAGGGDPDGSAGGAGVLPRGIGRQGVVTRRVPLRPIARGSAPVWLDDHRIAAQTDDRTTYRWFDLSTGDQGEIVDSLHGSTYWLAASPRDGTLAMWRNGAPGAAGARDRHLWVRTVGHEARPLAVQDALKYHLAPSWSPSGELLVCALETGVVSRVALDTGALTPIAQVPPTPVSRLFDNHIMTLGNGDLLAVEVELGLNVLAVHPDDQPRTRPRSEPDLGQL